MNQNFDTPPLFLVRYVWPCHNEQLVISNGQLVISNEQ